VLWAARHTVNIPATAIGVVTLVSLAVVRRRWPRIPGPLLVLAAISGAAILWGEPIATVKGSFGTLPAGIGWPQIPHVTWQMALDLVPAALAIALLAGIESLLSAVVADRMIGGRYRHGAELIAQGAANVGSALFGGLPATGAIARTATNIAAGGRTPVAGMIHAIVIWILVALAGDLVGWLILPGLAALLILTAWNMSEPHRWPDRLGRPWRHIIVILLTATLTLLVDLIVAIGVSTLVAFALGIRAERVPETE
jgi:SulP family sulfate permease